jgi:hypothetical protein
MAGPVQDISRHLHKEAAQPPLQKSHNIKYFEMKYSVGSLTPKLIVLLQFQYITKDRHREIIC